MANPRKDVSGFLADNDRFAIAKKRALTSTLMKPEKQKRYVELMDEASAIATEVALEHAGTTELSKIRFPRRHPPKKTNGNGHAKRA